MSTKPLEHLIPRIALAEAKYIGPRYARLFLERCGSVEQIFAGEEVLRRCYPQIQTRILRALYSRELWQKAEHIARWCLDEGIDLYFVGDDDYPRRLRECVDAPVVLYAQGAYRNWDESLSLSVVGTRNMSTYGGQMTDKLLRDLHAIDKDILVVSGLAYGVDVTAHRKALELGLPTIAVFAHGFDRIYPAVHRATALEILKTGAWLSEYPLGTNPDRYNFVGRNRIIAGLTDATLVVEAGLRSGSLITAHLARDYDREVLVVPGRVGDRYSEGCNELIAKMTGVLVSSGEDIARLLGWERKGDTMQTTFDFAQDVLPIDNPIYTLIAREQPIQLNDIVRRTGLTITEVSAQLFDLELDGYIVAMPGGIYSLAR